MKTKIGYIILFFFALVAFSCNKQAATSSEEREQVEEVVVYEPDSAALALQAYIIEYTKTTENPPFYHPIRFGEVYAYDMDQIIRSYAIPYQFADWENAFSDNEKSMERLQQLDKEHDFAYYMFYSYAVRNKEDSNAEWSARWFILLLDKDKKIVDKIAVIP